MVKKLKSFWSQYNVSVIFLGIFLIYLAINGSQTTWTSVTNIFLHSAILGTIALGMGMIILTGDIDLSVGSSFVLAGGLTILFFNKVNSIFLALVMAVLLGAVFGLINGILVGKFRMPAFIVTLSSMMLFRGGVLGVTGGNTVQPNDAVFKAIGQGYLPNIGNGKLNITAIVFGIVFFVIYTLLMVQKRKKRLKYQFDVEKSSIFCTSQQKVDTFFIFYTLKTEHSTPYIVLVSNSLMSMQVFLH